MKNLNVKTTVALVRVKTMLVDSLEILNSIPEEDFRKIVLFSQKQKKYLKNISDNSDRGNLFMMLFFFRELIETILHNE